MGNSFSFQFSQFSSFSFELYCYITVRMDKFKYESCYLCMLESRFQKVSTNIGPIYIPALNTDIWITLNSLQTSDNFENFISFSFFSNKFDWFHFCNNHFIICWDFFHAHTSPLLNPSILLLCIILHYHFCVHYYSLIINSIFTAVFSK